MSHLPKSQKDNGKYVLEMDLCAEWFLNCDFAHLATGDPVTMVTDIGHLG